MGAHANRDLEVLERRTLVRLQPPADASRAFRLSAGRPHPGVGPPASRARVGSCPCFLSDLEQARSGSVIEVRPCDVPAAAKGGDGNELCSALPDHARLVQAPVCRGRSAHLGYGRGRLASVPTWTRGSRLRAVLLGRRCLSSVGRRFVDGARSRLCVRLVPCAREANRVGRPWRSRGCFPSSLSAMLAATAAGIQGAALARAGPLLWRGAPVAQPELGSAWPAAAGPAGLALLLRSDRLGQGRLSFVRTRGHSRRRTSRRPSLCSLVAKRVGRLWPAERKAGLGPVAACRSRLCARRSDPQRKHGGGSACLPHLPRCRRVLRSLATFRTCRRRHLHPHPTHAPPPACLREDTLPERSTDPRSPARPLRLSRLALPNSTPNARQSTSTLNRRPFLRPLVFLRRFCPPPSRYADEGRACLLQAARTGPDACFAGRCPDRRRSRCHVSALRRPRPRASEQATDRQTSLLFLPPYVRTVAVLPGPRRAARPPAVPSRPTRVAGRRSRRPTSMPRWTFVLSFLHLSHRSSDEHELTLLTLPALSELEDGRELDRRRPGRRRDRPLTASLLRPPPPGSLAPLRRPAFGPLDGPLPSPDAFRPRRPPPEGRCSLISLWPGVMTARSIEMMPPLYSEPSGSNSETA